MGSRDWGADYILWLDLDQTFPPQSLVKLLSRGLPVVGANYPRRHIDVSPTAVKRGQDNAFQLVQTTPAKAKADMVEEVERVGFGMLLMHMDAVVSALGDQLYPLFEMRSLDDGGFIGEDALFCDRLRSAGLKMHVDHALSLHVGHVGKHNFMFR